MRRWKRSTAAGAAALIAMAMATAGCPDERATIEASGPSTESATTNTRAPLSAMAIDVASAHADRTLDVAQVKAVLREAEPAFVACLDPDGSTGIVALKVAVEDNGSVGTASVVHTTTYGTDDARACFERIVAVLRFPTPESHEPFELSLSLEVRPRYHEAEN